MLLCIVMLSASATFAADDTALADASDEIAVEENVLTASDDFASESSNAILADANDNIVTNDTFFNYFNETGSLLSNVTSDELIFEGGFGGLGIDYIFINKPIVFTGNGDAVFDGITFVVSSDNVTIDGFSIFQKDDYGILIEEDNVVISNNYLEFTALEKVNSYGIYASSNNLQIIDNIIRYTGNTNGTVVNNAVRIEGDDKEGTPAKSVVVSRNIFDIDMPSVDIGYDPDTWASTVMNDAIVFYYCEDLEFVENVVKVKYSDVTTAYGYDSLYAVSVRSDAYTSGEVQSKQVIIENNTIDIEGHSCAYAVYVCADDFSVILNNITSTSETYLAHGIDVDGPCAEGVVAINYITAEAPLATYGIYSYQYMGSIENITYDRNIINVTGYASAGMEIVECNPEITNNGILARGNYTYGIIASIRDEGVISDNVVLASGSNIGSDATGDGLMPKNSMGISVKGDCVIEGNIVGSTNIGINLAEEGDITINNNRIYVIPNALIDSYGIYSHRLSNLTVTDNVLYFVGNTDGTVVNNGVRIEGDDEDEPAPATNIVVSGNTFDLQLPSVDVSYDPDTWAATTMSEGIVFYYCENLKFTNNRVDLTYNNFTTAYGYDSLYAVSVRSDAYTFGEVQSKHVMIADNEINIDGHSATYAVYVCADDFSVLFNNITSTSETYLAHGIDVDGPCAEGLVAGNDIVARAPLATYGIYSYQYMGAIENVSYPANTIDVTGYASAGMEIVECNPEIIGNVITADGNYTYGIIASIRDEGLISRNEINVLGSNIGSDATGDGLMPKNSMAISVKGNSTIANNTLESTDIGINLVEDGQITVDNNNITVKSNTEDIDNHAVVANAVDYLVFTNNEVMYNGASAPKGDYKTAKAYAMYVVNSEVNVENNTFFIVVPSLPSDWEQVGDDWVRHSYTEGLVFNECDFSIVANNEIALGYNGGDFGSIYVIDVLDCDNFIVEHNDIDAAGEDYIYGIIVEGDEFTISENNISVESEYYTCGINVEESTGGIIDGNVIYTNSPGTAYPIYGGMIGEPSVVITNNTIVANSYFIVGVELSGKEVTVNDNLIDLKGNYTIGIGVYVDELIANNNTIRSKASNVGNVSIWDSIGTDTTAIKSKKGTVSIIDNFVETTGNYTVDIADDDGTVHDNYLTAKKRIGDNSVYSTGAATVYDNTPKLKVVLFASDLEKVYDDGKLFTVVALDEDGEPVINGTIYASIGDITLNVDTDENGVAEFDIELPEGVYNVTTDFLGDYVYGPRQINNTITVTTKDTTVVAPEYVEATAIEVKEHDAVVNVSLTDVDGKPLAEKPVIIEFNGVGGDFITDENGTVKYSLWGDAGEYALIVKFDGDENYSSCEFTADVSIVLAESKIVAPVFAQFTTVDVAEGDSIINITLTDIDENPLANKTVFIGIDGGEGKYTTDEKGAIQLLVLANAGEHTIAIEFAGDACYGASNATTEISIVPVESQIVAPEYAEYTIVEVKEHNATFDLTLVDEEGNPLANRDVVIELNGVGDHFTTDENGAVKYSLWGDAGNYTLIAKFEGDERYTKSNATADIVITPVKTEIVADESAVYSIVDVVSGNATFDLTLVDADGNFLANKTIFITFNGVTEEFTTDENGTVEYAISAGAGNYTIDMAFENDGYYEASDASATVSIVKAESKIFLRNALYFVLETKMVRITLWDGNNNPVEGKIVHITIGNSTWSGVTDKNGDAYIRVGIGFGVHAATVHFDGDDEYAASNRSGFVRVIKETPSVMVRGDNTHFKVSDATKTVKVYLWDRTSKPLPANSKIAIKVNGQTYVGYTDNTGVASINLDINAAGIYNAEVKYAGNSAYNAVTRDVKFVIQ